MTPITRRLSLPTAVLALSAAVLTGAGCSVNVNTTTAEARETRRFEVSAAPRVTLDTFDGAIEVHSWDQRQVEVEIDKRGQDDAVLQQIVVEATQDGDSVVVRVRGPERRHDGGITVGVSQSPSARLRVALPRDSHLEVVTGDGSVRIEDVAGSVVARSGDGTIQGVRLSGDVRLRTEDGAIRLERASGSVEAETDDGGITIDGQVQTLAARTGDGSVRVNVEDGTAIVGAWSLTTRDGTITLRLPRPLDAVIDASTSDGSITSSHPSVIVDREANGPRRRTVNVTAGRGGATMTLKTGDGSIRIE